MINQKMVFMIVNHSKQTIFWGLIGVFRPTGEGLQIMTYTRHSWPLSSEGSLACHTYWDREHPCIMVIWHTPVFEFLAVELLLLGLTTYVWCDRGLTPISRMRGERSINWVSLNLIFQTVTTPGKSCLTNIQTLISRRVGIIETKICVKIDEITLEIHT